MASIAWEVKKSGYQAGDKILLWRVPSSAKLEQLELKLIMRSARLEFFFWLIGEFPLGEWLVCSNFERERAVWGFSKETELFIDVIFGNDFVWTVLITS